MRRGLAFTLGCLLGWIYPGCNEESLRLGRPAMWLSDRALDFGAVAIGQKARFDVSVENRGDNYLRLAPPTLEGDQAAVFAVVSYGELIPPGDQAGLSLEFGPAEIGPAAAHALLVTNDPGEAQVEIALSGQGFRRGIIEVEPRQIQFGVIAAGATGLGEIEIRSLGNGDLTVTDLIIAPAPSDFQLLSSARTPAVLPPGAVASLRIAYRPRAASVPPQPTELLVSSDDPFQPQIAVALLASLNQAPVARAGEDQLTDPGRLLTLDGSPSFDPDGDVPLSFLWTLVTRPAGSTTALQDETTPWPTLRPDRVGLYEIELTVSDSTGLTSLLPDRVLVNAIPADRVRIELVWDSPLADLDLHLLAPAGQPGGPLDCHYANPRPDWGEIGNANDDPQLVRDDLMGFGPEIIGYENPANGAYALGVDYFATHTANGKEPTTATLRVFVDGLLRAELSRSLETQGEHWDAALLRWPEGTVSAVPGGW